MMKPILLTLAISMTAITGCRTVSTPQAATAIPPTPASTPAGTPMHRALPKAVLYKTNGDYTDNIPVTLNADGTKVVSYPAPTDITDLSTPLRMADGYLLDRRGVNADTRFTRYTYSQYRALQSPPSPAEILENVIPGSRVTDLKRLDITLQQALGDTAAINTLILNGFSAK